MLISMSCYSSKFLAKLQPINYLNEPNIRVTSRLELARAEFEPAFWLGCAILNSLEPARLVRELSSSWLQLARGSLICSPTSNRA
jgi:hypothetical protein